MFSYFFPFLYINHIDLEFGTFLYQAFVQNLAMFKLYL